MAEQKVKHLGDSDFDAEVADGVALVDFWAPWCGPCRAQGPILDEVAAAVAGTVTVAKVNVDEAPAIAGRFGIRSIPTLIVLKDGKPVAQHVGVQTTATLLRTIDNARRA